MHRVLSCVRPSVSVIGMATRPSLLLMLAHSLKQRTRSSVPIRAWLARYIMSNSILKTRDNEIS